MNVLQERFTVDCTKPRGCILVQEDMAVGLGTTGRVSFNFNEEVAKLNKEHAFQLEKETSNVEEDVSAVDMAVALRASRGIAFIKRSADRPRSNAGD
jgi:hypothetical protein